MASNAKKDKKQADKKSDETTKKRKPGELSRFQKIVIVAFIVVFALSTLAGALASVVQTQTAEDAAEDSQETTVESVDSDYEGIVASLESKVAENAEDKASLLSLGRYCFSWGANVSSLATTDEETAHANELFDKAIGYYDQYLALEDSPAARVDRALCQYYKGDANAAVTELTDITTNSPDYAPAWANLGMLYETQGLTDQARSAYEKATELDPDNEYGAYSYAQQRISALDDAAASAEEDSADGTSEGDAGSGEEADAGSGDAAQTDDAAQSDDAAQTDDAAENN